MRAKITGTIIDCKKIKFPFYYEKYYLKDRNAKIWELINYNIYDGIVKDFYITARGFSPISSLIIIDDIDFLTVTSRTLPMGHIEHLWEYLWH